jgi:hypothetical protein
MTEKSKTQLNYERQKAVVAGLRKRLTEAQKEARLILKGLDKKHRDTSAVLRKENVVRGVRENKYLKSLKVTPEALRQHILTELGITEADVKLDMLRSKSTAPTEIQIERLVGSAISQLKRTAHSEKQENHYREIEKAARNSGSELWNHPSVQRRRHAEKWLHIAEEKLLRMRRVPCSPAGKGVMEKISIGFITTIAGVPILLRRS